ncbi:putative zinc ribbon protein [Escherichia coli]|uniref:putative zinc ribbon protein n=2 Tax=Escherichia coli TaxID=562 RepID=UPI0040376C43
MLPSETMIWQPEFTDKTLSRKPGAVQGEKFCTSCGSGIYSTEEPLRQELSPESENG